MNEFVLNDLAKIVQHFVIMNDKALLAHSTLRWTRFSQIALEHTPRMGHLSDRLGAHPNMGHLSDRLGVSFLDNSEW